MPVAGVPDSTPALVSVTPSGKAPLVLKVGAGNPVAVKLNGVAATPNRNATDALLVILGARFTSWVSAALVVVLLTLSPE